MNNNERIEAREAYFDQYQKTLKKLDEVIAHTERVKEEFESVMSGCMDQRNYLNRELNAMRNVITYMLDNGCDPVEAKLTLTDESKIDHLWKQIEYDRDLYGTITVSTPYNTFGATPPSGSITSIGAIGATGANGPNGYLSSATISAISKLRP